MSDSQIVIAVKSDGTGARVIKRSLDDIAKSGQNATGAAGRLEKQMKATTTATQALSRAMGYLVAAVGIRELARMSDTMSVLQGRLDNATRSAQESAQAFDGLRRIAMTTGSSLEAAVSVFQRLSFVRDEIDATVSEMLRFTDTVSKLGVVSGASGEALRAGLTQLGQGLSSNILRAEEFNSIMENIPAVGKAIADQFGVTTGQLRQLVIEGEVLSEDVFAAVLRAAQKANEDFEKMPLTFARAAAVIGASFQGIFADIERTTGASNFLAKAMLKVADIVSGFGKIFVGAANLAQAAFKGVVGVLYDLFTGFANFAYTTLNGIISFANRLPGVEISMIPLNDREAFRKNVSADVKRDLEEASKAFSEAGGAFLGRDSSAALTQQEETAREISKNYAEIAKALSGSEDGAKAAKKAQDELTKAIKASRTEEERLLDSIRELEGMRGIAKTATESAQLEEAIRRANGELNELRIQAERDGPVAKAFESLANEIDDGFRDAFRSAFTSADNWWDGLIDGMKASFKTLLADLAYMAVARPIVLSVVGGVGGAMGLSSGANASILGSIGGTGGGGFSLGNIGSMASNLLNGGLYSNTLGGFGAGVGNLLSGQAWGAMGPSQAAAIGGGAFGNLGYGAIGGFGASLLGLGNENATVNMLTGGLGSLAGGAIGTSLGTILGMAGGPIGAIAGGFLGTALGGLFGPGEGRQTLGTKYKIGNDGMLAVKSTSTHDADKKTADKFAKSVTNSLNAVVQAMGATFAKALPGIETNIGNKDTGTFIGNTRISSKAGDVAAILRQVLKSEKYISGADADVLKVAQLSASMTKSVEQIVADITLANLVFGDTKTPADEAAEAIEGINEQFEAMYERAEKLGLPLDKVTEALEKQKEMSIGAVKAMQAGFQSMEAMKATFDSWLYDQSLSGTSTLTPAEKLAAAQGNFGDLLSKAQGGDYSVTQALLQSGQHLLTIGQGIYASSVDFATLEHFVRSSITQIAKDLDIPGYASGTMSARRGMAWVGEKGPELVNFRGGERVYNSQDSARMSARANARADEQAQEISGMREDIKNMNRQISRLVNKMMVA